MNKELTERLKALSIRQAEVEQEYLEISVLHFSPGTVVAVDHERYHGQGIVTRQSCCPFWKLPVRLENGNVWWYETETATPVTDYSKFEPWIKRSKRRSAGRKGAETRQRRADEKKLRDRFENASPGSPIFP